MNNGRILVVEDNMDTYELMNFFLVKYGYETFLAVNGRAGIDAAINQKPDLIIMDLAMPEMDGWTATQRIKEHPQTLSIPLVVVTAHALVGDRQRAMEAGCDEYIPKPIDLQELLRTIQHWMSRA